MRISFNEFLERRGIERNKFYLKENSILLQKIINLKRYQNNKNQKYTSYIPYNTNIDRKNKRKIITNRLQKRTNDYEIFKDKDKQNKNSIYSNYISNFRNISNNKIILKEKEKNEYDNLSINHNLFTDTINSKNYNEKEYIFHTSTKPVDKESSNKIILNRINRNSKDKFSNKNNNSLNHKYLVTDFKINTDKVRNNIINKTDKKFIYKKKINKDKFKKKINLSRNKIGLFYNTNNNSKENSICNSIDFSIINKTNITDKSNILSKTTESFFILSNKKTKQKLLNKNQIRIRNIKFMNHFIKYCYLYYMIIIKKFYINLKKIRIDSFSNLSNLISNHKNTSLFEEFNKDDFDKETINYRTSENFYDGMNSSFLSLKKNKKGLVYNRNNRIFNQNYQTQNLLKILNNSQIENGENIPNYENKKFIFDNEKETNETNDNNNERSPFFNGKSNLPDNDKINLSKIKSNKKDTDTKDNNIIGFIQINNEINPFKIKNNNINFFNEAKNQITESEEEILSFRQKNPDTKSIIKLLDTKSEDNKLIIDIKYLSNEYHKHPRCYNKFFYDNNELTIQNFGFQILNNYKRIKKISMRVKDSKIIKENEDYIDLNNNENRKNYLYSLSIIKEEEDDKNINESSLKKTIPIKINQHYYNISNNSKLLSKASIEKIIDGDKVIKEEDIDNILMKSSSSRYGHYNKKSQEIMVVSNFCSVMRNRINRKENAKSLINGILLLIQFFGSLCFNIRKKTYLKFKMYWKINRLITHVIRYGIKDIYKKIKKANSE